MSARWLVRLSAFAAVAVVMAACGDTDEPSPSTSNVSTSNVSTSNGSATTSASPTSTPPTSAAPTSAAAEPFSADTADKQGPSSGSPSGQLVAVRMARQDGFDRFVLEFAEGGIPQYLVAYDERPITNTADAVIDVDGTYVLSVLAFPARAIDIEDPDFAPTYLGPKEITADTSNLQQAVFVEDFEANMHWVLGLDAHTGFEVSTLRGPPRVIVDVSHS